MVTYIVLGRWTQQGIERVKDSVTRLTANKEIFESFGVTLKSAYLVIGQYDFVMVIEAPSDEIVAQLLLMIGAKGDTRTETLRAFPEVEYESIIESLP
jgi:uncharacterized protein with GYD domain